MWHVAGKFSLGNRVSWCNYLIIKKEFFDFEIVIRRKKLFTDFLKEKSRKK